MDNSTPLPDLMVASEVIAYLRLDTDDRDPAERLRNLIRRQRLPVIRRGRLRLFRRSAIDSWLDAGQRGGRTSSPARLVGKQRLTAKFSAARSGRAENGNYGR